MPNCRPCPYSDMNSKSSASQVLPNRLSLIEAGFPQLVSLLRRTGQVAYDKG